MKKFLHLFTNKIEGINKIHFVLLFVFISSYMFGQSINTSKTVTSSSCGVIDVQLGFTGVNPTKGPVEVILVIDVSGSMGSSSGSPTSLSRAQDAAIAFVNKILDDPLTANGLNPSGLNKVGLVSFSTTGSLVRNLTTYNETGTNNGKADLITAIKNLTANGSTNIEDGVLKADNELKLSSTGFNCNTTRSIVLLSDGVANVRGTSGTQSCSVPTFPATTLCIDNAITAGTAAKTTTPIDNPALTTTFNNQIYSIGLFGGINGNDQLVAEYTLKNISNSTGSPYYFQTELAADLTTIYTQIANQLNYVAKDLVVTENIPAGYGISNVTASSGTLAPVSPPTTGPGTIVWTNNLLTTAQITLSYKLTPDGTKCGDQTVSTTGYSYVNSLCNPVTGQSVTTPNYFITCKPVITGSPSVCTGTMGSVYSVPNIAGHTYAWTVIGGTITAGAGTNSITVTWGAAGAGKVDVTDTFSSCPLVSTKNVTINALPSLSAGTAFTKTCTANINGATIGETNDATATYLWSPALGLSSATISNPTANPLVTTTYTVTKTNILSGCTATANVVVTVNNSVIAVNDGTAFTKTCTENTSGALIGEPNDATATYLWSPVLGLSSASVSNPTANPIVTTTYTVTKTNILSGCTATANVVVTVNNAAITVSAGTAFTKTCTANTSGAVIGEINDPTATYLWTPSLGLSSTLVSNPTANPLVTTTYTVTKTNILSGCTATANVVVTVNNAAIAVSAGTAFTKTCTDNTSGAVIGEANDATATYSWSPALGLSSATVSNPTANPTVTTTYTVTKTNILSGCTATANVVVTVNNSAIAVNAGTVFTKTCTANIAGAIIGETNDATATYSWSPSLGLSSATISNPTANPLITTTYTVTKTNILSGCTATANVVVTVNNAAIAVNAGNPFTKTCTANINGATIGETNDATATYLWSPALGLSSASVSNPTANPAVTTTYTVTKTNILSGCTTTANVVVTVNNSSIAVNAGTAFTKTCTANINGATIGETNDTTGTYLWSPALGLSSATISNPTANPLVTTTYTVTKTNILSGCTATANVVVTVNNATIAVNAGTAFTKTCNTNINGATIGETNNETATYSWNPALGLSSATVSNPKANPAVTTTYTVTKTNILSGCTATANVVVTVNNAAIAVSAGTAFTKTCTDNTSGAVIGEANDATATYSWSPALGLSSATISNPTANPLVTTTYTVTKTNILSGCTATANVVVTVNNSAIAVNAGTAFTKTCTANINGATIGEPNDATATYSWSPVLGLSSATISNPMVNPAVTTTYTVTKTNILSGCTATANVVVTVNNSAIAVNAGTAFTKTCTANINGATIGEANDATATYSWSPALGLSSTTVSNPTANPAVTTTYTVVKTNILSGCTATANIVVTVNNSAIAVNAGNPFTKTCTTNIAGAVIGETNGPTATYLWSPALGLSSNTVSNPTANPLVTTTYTVTKTNILSGCTATANVVVTVNNAAIAVNAGTAFTKTCTTNITGAIIGEINDATATYSWSPALGLSSATVSNPMANPLVTTTYTVTKTNILSGCTATANVVVTVDIAIPTLMVSNPMSVCSPSIVDITSNNVQTTNNGTTTSYYSTLELANAGSTSDVTNPTAISTSGTYYIRSEFENGCFVVKPVIVSVSSCSIALVKESVLQNAENCTKVGNTITYKFTVTNPGTTPISNISITDPLFNLPNPAISILFASGDSNSDMNLDSNETWTYNATYIVTQTDIDLGYITNQATVNGFVLGNNPVSDLSGTNSTNNDPTITRLCQNPAIAIVKTNDMTTGENGCATIKVGDKVNYTFTVTNLGNVSLHNVAVTDLHQGLSAIALLSGDANTNTILEVGEIWVFKADYSVTQADIDAGTISNQASVNALAPDNSNVTDQSGNSSNTNGPNVIPICTNPAIAIVKTNDMTAGENGCATIKVGDKVNYTFTVTNLGNVSLHNIAVTDLHQGLSAIALLSGDANTNTILEVGEIWIFKADYTVTQADIDAGTITNQASVNALTPDNSNVTDQSGNSSNTNAPNVIPICTNPAIAIVKTNDMTAGENGCTTIKVGDKVNYTFTVTNLGNVSLHNVAVIDLHQGLSAIALLSGDANTNTILEIGEIWIFKADYTVTQADIDAGIITNQASVNALAPNNSTVTDQSGNSSNTNAPNVIPICSNPAIAIVKTNDMRADENGCIAIKVGDKVNYTFTVTNLGNVSLHNVAVTDLHQGLSAIALLSGDANTNTILEVGEIWIFKADYTVTQADIDAGSITNQASVNALAPDNSNVTDQSGNSSTINAPNVIPICSNPAIAITKDGTYVDTNQDEITNVGDRVSYNFIVKNTGNVTLTNVTVTDNNAIVSGGPISSLASGATDSTTFSASHVITQADINKGFVYNLALATAKDPKGNDVTDTSSDPTPCTTCPKDPECLDCTITVLNQTPSITITKDGTYVDTNQDGITNVGDRVSYNFIVKNTGNVTVTNITVTDNNATVSGGPITSLASGATDSNTFSASHVITQADINKGFVYNLALATAKDPKGNDVTDTSSDPTPCTTCPKDPECLDCTITTLNQTPSLTVEKTATVTSNGTETNVYSFVGDVIHYTINVTNNGNISINNIVVKDPLTGLDTTSQPFSLAPGEHREFMQEYTIALADIRVNAVTNVATANGLTPNNTLIEAEDTLIVEKAIVLGCGTIVVHNAFTPNQDGINDNFVIDNITDTTCYPENSVEIYNRWGILVYETKGYNNANNAFKGYSEGRVTVDKSAGLPSGTYFYFLNYTAVGLQGELIGKKEQGYLYLTR